MMYFDEISIYNEEPEMSGVDAYCAECGAFNTLSLDKFDELKDGDYVILKQGVIVKCRSCGNVHEGRKITYRRKSNYAPPRPKCPACGSIMLKKIKSSQKLAAAAMVGVFALPYTSKTFECQNCKYRF